MKVNTIHIEAPSTVQGGLTLAQSVEKQVEKFLKDNNGELVSYVLSGTTLGQGPFGQALATINWEPKTVTAKKK